MQSVLIDACGWAACIDAKLNIQNEMESLLGPCEWLVIPKVLEELVDLEQQRPAGKGLLLDLLRSKSTLIGAEHIGHTCLLYTSPSPRDATLSRMPSSA